MSTNIELKSRFGNFDWFFLLVASLTTGIGLVLIFSATSPMADAGRTFLVRQIAWFSLALVLTAIIVLFDYTLFERWAVWIYIFMVICLVAVWGVGKVTAGSRRWIDLGFMRFQPSEFTKLALVLVLAKYLQLRESAAGLQWREFVQAAGLILAPTLLVLVQPDLGTSIMIALIGISMVLFAGLDKKLLAVITGLAATAAVTLYCLKDYILLDYQRKRLMTFLSPDFDPLGSGYHIIQSQIAIGSGGLFGKGFMQGTQNQLMFLPVKHTDFVFSILAEEWGFVGCLVILLLFSIMLLRGLSISAGAHDDFGALAAFGCTAIIFWHVVINIGMVTGLLPVVGVPLIFLSYGGSSLLVSFMCVAILINIHMRRFSRYSGVR